MSLYVRTVEFVWCLLVTYSFQGDGDKDIQTWVSRNHLHPQTTAARIPKTDPHPPASYGGT